MPTRAKPARATLTKIAVITLRTRGIECVRYYRHKPLLDRKAVLRKINPSGSRYILYADFVIEHGIGLFRTACERDLEGIVAKQKNAPYSASVRWVKIKNAAYSQVVDRIGEQSNGSCAPASDGTGASRGSGEMRSRSPAITVLQA